MQIELIPFHQAPAWIEVPNLDRRSIQHANQGLSLAKQLLAQREAQLLCVHVAIASTPRRPRVTYWQATGPESFRLFAVGSKASTLEIELYGCLSDMMSELHKRWPDNAAPRQIGVAMDGHNIVFNTSHPSCEGADWLQNHRSGEAPASLLIGSTESIGLPALMMPKQETIA